MASLMILCITLHFFHLAHCEPVINFPLNSQLPPVARVDEPFSYTFMPYTFKADSAISYSLGDAPKWLSISSKTGRLYGTPTEKTVPSGDVVGQTVEIVADDGSGSSTLNATLVVSRNKSPSVNIPFADQAENLGDFSAPSSLLFYPSTKFSFSFDSKTFSHQPNMVNYYASSNDSSPLPSWVKFNSDTLTFSGKTPPFESLIQPPQTFGFKLIASDIVGFSAAYVPFYIAVGSHKLSSSNPIIMMNATRGKKFSYDRLRGEIKLDKKAAQPSDVIVSTKNMPDWLSFDNQTWAIEGTPKQKEDHSTNFTINFRDSHSDTLSVLAIVNVATRLFRSTISDISLRAGKDVDIDLKPYFWDPSEINLEMVVSPEKNWLELDGFNITGKLPRSATGKLNISLTVTSKTTQLEETASLSVKILTSTRTTQTTSLASKTSVSTTSTSESTSSSETTSSVDEGTTEKRHGVSTTTILLATILPILTVCFLLALLIFCLVRRRRRSPASYLSTTFRNKISGPVLESLRVNGTNPNLGGSEKNRDGVTMRTPLYRPAREDYSEEESTSSPRSSPIPDILPTPEVPARFLMEDSMRHITRTASMPITGSATDGRQSWYTVATATATATARRSENSLSSHISDTTFSESTHQLLPPPAFLSDSGSSFRSGLDLAIPSLEDLPNMRHSDVGAMRAELRRTRDPSGFYSSAPESSLAFSSSHQSSPRLMTGAFSRKPSDISLGKRPATVGGITAEGTTLLEEAAATVPEMRRPSQTRLASQQRLNRQHSRGLWYDTDGSSMGRSFRSEPSSGSTENWRVLPKRRENASDAYRRLVETAPFHPARPSTAMSGREGAQPGERGASPELMSPSQWGDAKTSIRGSGASHRSRLGTDLDRKKRVGL
ncbi:hypothetical protein B0J13DRAFT_523922 [Dactylonectria estremocensis]|uniref:Dystroglycan-type cadherin-like domain-containing protein n=1 Tax=Dactylonectria estremocensis TaxID=1079267 RepID=A0A9P9EZX1_9HYPO|nr:hypothetical protein B0J13DRAFT_523922 [Dactylonectria estremocensis]